MSFLVAALFSTSLSLAVSYPVYVPVHLELNLKPILLGKIYYFGGFSIWHDGSSNHYTSEIFYDFYLNDLDSKTLLKSKLARNFDGELSCYRFDDPEGIHSTTVIQEEVNQDVKKYFNLLLGNKSAQISSLHNNFHQSKTLKVVFKNLRTPTGVVTKSTSFLRFVFNNGSYDVYYRHSKSKNEIKINNLDVKITVSTLLSSTFSIELNHGSTQLIQQD